MKRIIKGALATRFAYKIEGDLEMNYLFVLITVLGSIAIGLVAVMLATQRGKRSKAVSDYRSFYILGLTWIPLGVALAISLGHNIFWALAVTGLAFLAFGLNHRDKWKYSWGD